MPTSQRRSLAAGSFHGSFRSARRSRQGNWRVSKLMGLDVYNASNEKLGDINDVRHCGRVPHGVWQVRQATVRGLPIVSATLALEYAS